MDVSLVKIPLFVNGVSDNDMTHKNCSQSVCHVSMVDDWVNLKTWNWKQLITIATFCDITVPSRSKTRTDRQTDKKDHTEDRLSSYCILASESPTVIAFIHIYYIYTLYIICIYIIYTIYTCILHDLVPSNESNESMISGRRWYISFRVCHTSGNTTRLLERRVRGRSREWSSGVIHFQVVVSNCPGAGFFCLKGLGGSFLKIGGTIR